MENSINLQKQIDKMNLDIKKMQSEIDSLKSGLKTAPLKNESKMPDIDLSDDIMERMRQRKLALNSNKNN
jgi:hypothetical protein